MPRTMSLSMPLSIRAASLAAVLSGVAERSGRIAGPIVAVISGGNMSADSLVEWMAKG